jgi:hypothetical protein
MNYMEYKKEILNKCPILFYRGKTGVTCPESDHSPQREIALLSAW